MSSSSSSLCLLPAAQQQQQLSDVLDDLQDFNPHYDDMAAVLTEEEEEEEEQTLFDYDDNSASPPPTTPIKEKKRAWFESPTGDDALQRAAAELDQLLNKKKDDDDESGLNRLVPRVVSNALARWFSPASPTSPSAASPDVVLERAWTKIKLAVREARSVAELESSALPLLRVLAGLCAVEDDANLLLRSKLFATTAAAAAAAAEVMPDEQDKERAAGEFVADAWARWVDAGGGEGDEGTVGELRDCLLALIRGLELKHVITTKLVPSPTLLKRLHSRRWQGGGKRVRRNV